MLHDGSFLGARMDGGVAVRPANYVEPLEELWLGINLGPAEKKVMNFARAAVGKPYNMRGILGFAIGEDWNKGRSFFCSQLVAYAFEQAGFPLLRVEHADRVTPAMLTMSLKLTEIESPCH